MNARKIMLVAASVLITLGAAASSYFPEFFHEWHPVVGGWSTYHIKDARGEQSKLTFAIVDKDAQGYWLELRMPGDGGEAVAAFLIKGDPTDDANVLMVRTKDPGSPALQIDKATLVKLRTEGSEAFGGQAASIGPTVGKLKGMPKDTLEVDGKTLVCRHLKVLGPHGRDADVWLNDTIVPFGVVKLVSGKEEIVLEKFGKGAKPVLKGPYKKLEVP